MHLHVHLHLEGIPDLLKIGERIMATLDEVKAAVAAEAQQVKDRVDALEAQVVALQEQVAAGGAATAADLDGLIVSIQGIFTPATPADPQP